MDIGIEMIGLSSILRSNEVWFVQAYDPNDGSCKSFATGWEDRQGAACFLRSHKVQHGSHARNIDHS